ncbi:MAG: zf-HC2 domain-containing protein [Terriglobales bacterium]|jgi:anti-sigma factor RsiW
MSCDLWRDKLDAYVDSACSPDEVAALEAHLQGCSSCAAEALSRLQMKRMTKAAAARYAPSREFRLRIEKSIEAKRRPLWAFARFPEFAFLAIALVFLAVGSTLWIRHSAREQALAELVDLHVATLASANPVDVISTDRHTVKPWFQGKLPFTFNLPELQNSPFKLLGGRVMYFEHAPGAQLLFQIRSHQLSVFIFQDRAGTGSLSAGVTAERELAFSVETWSDGELRYVVVSDANRADVHELGELMRAAK